MYKVKYILTEGAVLFSVTIHDFVVVNTLLTTTDIISATYRWVVCSIPLCTEPNINTLNVDDLTGKLTRVQSEDVI